jgi:hypothetical protein
MNDYLWNKTGSDAEVEEFENLLRQFAYRETAPPALPVKAAERPVANLKLRRMGYAKSALAAAACLLIAAIVSVALLMRQSTRPLDSEQAAITTPITLDENDEFVPVALSDHAAPAPLGNHGEKRSASVQKIARTVTKRAPVKLTKEEAYAYDQLKLALSITGSKLKLIKDRVDNIDDEKAVSQNGR